MDYKVQIFQMEDTGEWAVWYKDADGQVIEKYGFKLFEDVSRFVETEVLA